MKPPEFSASKVEEDPNRFIDVVYKTCYNGIDFYGESGASHLSIERFSISFDE